MVKSYEPGIDKVLRQIETGPTTDPRNPLAGISERNFLGGYARRNRQEIDAHLAAMEEGGPESRQRVKALRAKVEAWARRKPIVYNDHGPSFASMRLTAQNRYSFTLPSEHAFVRLAATLAAVTAAVVLLYMGVKLRQAIVAIAQSEHADQLQFLLGQ